MVLSSGPSNVNSSSQPVSASVLRTDSGILGAQGGANAMPSHSAYPSLISPRMQFNSVNIIGNAPNVSSLLHQSFGNNGSNSGPGNIQRGVNESRAEPDPMSVVGNRMGYNPQPSFAQSNIGNSGLSGQMQGQQFSNPLDQQSRQLDRRNQQHNQQQLQQLSAPQNNPSSVSLEPQQSQRTMRAVTMEPQHSDQSIFLQQQQQQQMLHMSRSSPQSQISLLQQQRLAQFHHQHQQQQQLAFKSLPLQRPPSQPQIQPQNLPLRTPLKPAYEPGMCARRLTHYTFEQRQRPEDNSMEFWRKFVAEFFAPNAKKKWCVSMYGSGRQTTGVFPQDVWHCEICNRKPGRGFEATVEVLPRLFKIKFESGTLEELLYVDMPREYQNSAGQIVLDYAKAIQESVFDQLRVVRDGQLRIVFSQDLKICSWEFCARRHDELIPRRLLIPQVSQLGAAAQKYQASTQGQNTPSNLSVPELQSNCNMFVASAKQVVKALEVPLVNDLGYTKRYVRCLQISEVVNIMKDLIDYTRETGVGPMDGLVKFPRRASTPSIEEQLPQQQQLPLPPPSQQQAIVQSTNNNQSLKAPSGNGVPSANQPLTLPPITSTANAIAGLLHQNSMNSRDQYPSMKNANSPLPNPSHFPSPTRSSSNNGSQIPPNFSTQQALSGDRDPNDSQSSVQKIINQMMLNSQSNGAVVGNLGNDLKNMNRAIPTSNGVGVMNGVRASMGNNGMAVNGRVGAMGSMGWDQSTNNQPGVGGPLFTGFNNRQFDWKSSP